MKKTELKNCPQWLIDADTANEDVEVLEGVVVWHGGEWCGGEWRGGTWRGGTWRGGTWRGGVWNGGAWHDPIIEDRIAYMCGMIGVYFDADGIATAYRSVNSDMTGKHNNNWVQPLGEYYEDDALPSGPSCTETCTRGVHVTSAARAKSYFGVVKDDILIKVKFHRKDVLGCDGEKIRIRGGFFEKVDWMF